MLFWLFYMICLLFLLSSSLSLCLFFFRIFLHLLTWLDDHGAVMRYVCVIILPFLYQIIVHNIYGTRQEWYQTNKHRGSNIRDQDGQITIGFYLFRNMHWIWHTHTHTHDTYPYPYIQVSMWISRYLTWRSEKKSIRGLIWGNEPIPLMNEEYIWTSHSRPEPYPST